MGTVPSAHGRGKGHSHQKLDIFTVLLKRKEGASERLLCLRLGEQLIRLAAILAFIYEMYSIPASLRHLRVSDKIISIKRARTAASVAYASAKEK